MHRSGVFSIVARHSIMYASIDVGYYGELPTKEHLAILEAFQNRAPDAARKRMCDHIFISRDKVLRLATGSSRSGTSGAVVQPIVKILKGGCVLFHFDGEPKPRWSVWGRGIPGRGMGDLIEGAGDSGIDPAIVYAMNKTGRIETDTTYSF
jgi:hypothetical protein